MAKVKEPTCEDINEKIYPDKISERTFELLNSGNFWEDFKYASWMTLESTTIKNSYEKLKDEIVLLSKQIDIKYDHLKQLSIVQEVYVQFKKEIEEFLVEHRKKVRKANIRFFAILIVAVPALYLVTLIIGSKSLSPSNWYLEYLHHVEVAGNIIKMVLTLGITLGLLFLSFYSCSLFDEKIIKKGSKNPSHPSGIYLSISFIITGILLMIILNGVKATFGIDLWPKN